MQPAPTPRAAQSDKAEAIGIYNSDHSKFGSLQTVLKRWRRRFAKMYLMYYLDDEGKRVYTLEVRADPYQLVLRSLVLDCGCQIAPLR